MGVVFRPCDFYRFAAMFWELGVVFSIISSLVFIYVCVSNLFKGIDDVQLVGRCGATKCVWCFCRLRYFLLCYSYYRGASATWDRGSLIFLHL